MGKRRIQSRLSWVFSLEWHSVLRNRCLITVWYQWNLSHRNRQGNCQNRSLCFPSFRWSLRALMNHRRCTIHGHQQTLRSRQASSSNWSVWLAFDEIWMNKHLSLLWYCHLAFCLMKRKLIGRLFHLDNQLLSLTAGSSSLLPHHSLGKDDDLSFWWFLACRIWQFYS